MAVTDMISHMYESEQVTKLVEQIELATKNLELVQQYTDTYQSAYDKAHANYSKAKQVYNNIAAIKDYYDQTKSTLLGRYNQIIGLYNDMSDAELEDLTNLLDGTFKDPRNMPLEDWAKFVDRQYDTRQMGLKELMDANEDTLNSMEGKVSHLEDLADQADATASPKEAQDVTNALLLEILQVLHEMLAMDAKYQQVMATQQYKGVTAASIEERQATLKSLETDISKYRFEVQVVDDLGVDLEDVTAFEIMEQTINN
jgi:glutathionylspermidine synthase